MIEAKYSRLKRSLLLIPILLFTSLFFGQPAIGQDASDSETGTEDSESDNGRTPDLSRGQSGAPTLDEALEASQIRLSVVNGLVEAIGNIKRARFTLEYELLAGESFQASAQRQRLRLATDEEESEGESLGNQKILNDYMCAPKPIKIRLRNEDLGKPDTWNLKANEEKCLKAVLGIEELSLLSSQQFSLTENPSTDEKSINVGKSIDSLDEDFNNFWLRKDNDPDSPACIGTGYSRQGCGRSIIEGTTSGSNNERVSTEQFIAMLRDRGILRDLLRSRGIAYEIQIKGEADIISPDLPDVSFRDITWELTINETLLRPTEGSKNDLRGSVSLYRVGAKATLGEKPFEINFRQGVEDPKLSIAADFRTSLVTAGIAGKSLLTQLVTAPIAGVPVIDEFSPSTKELLTSLKENNSASQLDVLFNNVTEVPFGSLIVNGILGGTENTSIIAGGLIGSDEVQALTGANLEFTSSGSVIPGVLFGVGPGGDESTLFIGPSVRASIFTLSPGVRVFDDDGGTLIRPGGVISLDLSRTTGSKKPQEIRLPNSTIGGGWEAVEGLLARDISRNATFVGLKVSGTCLIKDKDKGEEEKVANIRLWQKTDADGKTVPANNRFKYSLPLGGNDKSNLTLLPKGTYALEIPQGCEVQRDSGGIPRIGDPKTMISSQSIPTTPTKPRPSVDAGALVGAIESVAEAIQGEDSDEKPPKPLQTSEVEIQKDIPFLAGYNDFEITVSNVSNK